MLQLQQYQNTREDTWTIEQDEQLLQVLKQIQQKLETRNKQVLTSLQNAELLLDSCSSSVQNTVAKFVQLKDQIQMKEDKDGKYYTPTREKSFRTQSKKETQPVRKPQSFSKETADKYTIAVQNGIQSIQQESIKDYNQPLPHTFGTRQFFQDSDVGIGYWHLVNIHQKQSSMDDLLANIVSLVEQTSQESLSQESYKSVQERTSEQHHESNLDDNDDIIKQSYNQSGDNNNVDHHQVYNPSLQPYLEDTRKSNYSPQQQQGKQLKILGNPHIASPYGSQLSLEINERQQSQPFQPQKVQQQRQGQETLGMKIQHNQQVQQSQVDEVVHQQQNVTRTQSNLLVENLQNIKAQDALSESNEQSILQELIAKIQNIQSEEDK